MLSKKTNCSYEVTFVTPAACKIQQVAQDSATEKDCVFKVADDVKLNFTSLPKPVS